MRMWTTVAGLALSTSIAVAPPVEARKATFTDSFQTERCTFATRGRNPYFLLIPGHRLELEGKDGNTVVHLTITVLGDTLTVDGVETRVVEERETHAGQLREVSRNYFAISKRTNNVYYFGEDVDAYKHGKVSNHEGSWQSGKDGAHYGLFMPAKPQVGQRFYQEIAPKKAMDRCEITSVTEKATVPAGAFEHCVKTRETTPLEPETRESKVYAPQAGLLIDGGLKLEKYGAAAK